MNTDKCKSFIDISNAINSYIADNTSFESAEAVKEVTDKLHKVNSFDEVFRIPISSRLFNFNTSLNWLYFVCFIIYTINDEHIKLPSKFNIAFSTNDAIIYIANTFDSINKELMHDYFDDSDEE